MEFKNIRESLTLLLVGLLPFHAFLVTVGTKMLMGPEYAPLTSLALWKEALLGIILLLAFVEWVKKPSFKIDIFDGLILLLLAVSVVVTVFTHGNLLLYLYGFKYDFVPLIAFIVLRRVDWSDGFVKKLFKWILVSAGIVSVYGIISFYLPMQWFTWLGYSDLHSLYNPGGPLAAFQQIGDSSIRRIQSVMSGPNQLGIWLLIPLSIVLSRKKEIGQWSVLIGVFIIFTMMMTMSRSAGLAAGAMVAVVLWKQMNLQQLLKLMGALFVVSFAFATVSYFFIPEVALRAASTSGHIAKPVEAMSIMKKYPFGLGLGTAGPASNRISDTCVHLPEDADTSWAQDRPELCVFAGEVQVQPEDRDCACPLLTENWFLQMGVEMGITGFALFIVLTVLLILEIGVVSPALLSLVGISIASLFLHAWEDAAIAYTVWLLVALSLRVSNRPRRQS